MILDTNALSAMADGEAEIAIILRQQKRIALPVIVLGEFLYGIAQSRHRNDYEEWLTRTLPLVDVLPVIEQTTEHYSAISVNLRRAGKPIPTNDIWIAALAREHGLPVLSRDGHFDDVADVKRVSW